MNPLTDDDIDNADLMPKLVASPEPDPEPDGGDAEGADADEAYLEQEHEDILEEEVFGAAEITEDSGKVPVTSQTENSEKSTEPPISQTEEKNTQGVAKLFSNCVLRHSYSQGT